MPQFEHDTNTDGYTKIFIRLDQRPPIELLGESRPVNQPWPESAAECLEWAIQKWKYIVKIFEEEGIDGDKFQDRGYQTCALCQRFKTSNDNGECFGCPVRERVGVTGCGFTPYETFSEVSTVENARAELEFLEGLRDLAKGLDDGTVKPRPQEIEEEVP
jgi:hypothetical protein